MIQEGKAITLRDGNQTISLSGLKAALLFIDAQQKRVGSETAWIKKGDEPPLSVPPAPALKEVAVVNQRRRHSHSKNVTICWIMETGG